jgi:serine/threonine-protein kinase RsbW
MVHTQSLSLPRNGHSVPFIELRQTVASQVAAISPLADQLMRFILRFRSADGSETDIELALHEALANAVIHGNGESSSKRIVRYLPLLHGRRAFNYSSGRRKRF